MNCVVMCNVLSENWAIASSSRWRSRVAPEARPVEIEYRRPDFFDDCLKVVDILRKSLLHFGRSRPRDGPLQGKPDGEKSLDDVIVQISSDTVAVGEHVEFARHALRGGQLPGKRCLVGEGGHHLFLILAERRRLVVPQCD